MSAKQAWHPLQIAGVVFLINSLVFAALAFLNHAHEFIGVIIGCAGTGLAITVVGFVLSKRAGTPDNEASA